MTRVLVTGGSGLLGSTLVPVLRTRGHDVRTHGRTCGDIVGDLSDREQACAALDAVEPSIIVNLAALTDVDACERDPQRAYIANVRVVENLASWIRARGSDCHLVHISTDQVYDGPGAHREDDVTISNHYGFSKYAGELACACVSRTVLRTNFFGPSRQLVRRSWSDWLVDSLTSRMEITVFDDVSFSPLSIQAIAELVYHVTEVRIPGVFNVGSKQGMTKADFAFALASALGLPLDCMARGRSTDLNRAARRPTGMCMDSSRFERVYGVHLPTLQDEIDTVAAEYAERAR